MKVNCQVFYHVLIVQCHIGALWKDEATVEALLEKYAKIWCVPLLQIDTMRQYVTFCSVRKLLTCLTILCQFQGCHFVLCLACCLFGASVYPTFLVSAFHEVLLVLLLFSSYCCTLQIINTCIDAVRKLAALLPYWKLPYLCWMRLLFWRVMILLVLSWISLGSWISSAISISVVVHGGQIFNWRGDVWEVKLWQKLWILVLSEVLLGSDSSLELLMQDSESPSEVLRRVLLYFPI